MSPNVTIREQLQRSYGLDRLKEIWKEEAKPKTQVGLAQVITLWPKLKKGFELRNRLVHGGKPTSSDYAADRIEWLLQAAREVQQFCEKQGIDLYRRLRVRRKPYRSPAG